MESRKKVLELIDLTVRSDQKTLYDSFNFTVYEGDRYIMFGPNGAGKTRLLQLLIRGRSADFINKYKLQISGRILDSNGNDLLDPNTNRSISYASQDEEEQRYHNATIFSQAESACNVMGVILDTSKLDDMLNIFGLSGKRTVKIRSLSGGEKKIVQLITKLLVAENTNIMLLDEPLNHLSFQNSRLFNERLNETIKNNPKISIIAVSHCHALNFTDKALIYKPDIKTLTVSSFLPYDCFTRNFA